MSEKERFLELCAQIHRDGVLELMDWLERSDFYIAPASTRFHGNYPGGLLQHSLNVYDELQRILKVYPEISVSPETTAIVSLFHDLCKVNFYVSEKRNRKTAEGKWESYDAYTIKEKLCFGGHGSMKLTPAEAIAINCHMGSWDGNKDVGNAYSQNKLAWALHVADEAATYILESE